MKVIQLTQGYSAKVSDKDFERINQFNWFANVSSSGKVRAARCSLRRMIYMQHQVLELMPWELPTGFDVDHEDGDSLNNQDYNLRVLTHMQNSQNTRRHKERKGYCFNARARLWACYLDEPGRGRIYLGYTKTEAEAITRVAEARHESR